MPMTTTGKALETARAYVTQNRSGCHVVELLEDEKDYYVQLALDDPKGAWPLGPGPIFVTKATGKLWSDAYGNVLDKIYRMQTVDPEGGL